jgi:hypothetical protein
LKVRVSGDFLELRHARRVGVVADKRRWFEQVIALRRAERAAPGVREIPEVRAQLEEQVGSAVSMALAANILEVSEAAIRRWVRRGEIPTAISEAGRTGIPVGALADLYEQVVEQRARGRRHVLEPQMKAARIDAERMRVDTDVPTDDAHARSLARALAYHRAIGENSLGDGRAGASPHLGMGESAPDRP